MAVQSRSDNDTRQLIKSGNSFVKNGIIAQDAQRTEDLLKNTIMAYNALTAQWTPFNLIGQLHGISIPQGIYLGDDIAAADLVAGNIEDCEILIGGACTIDSQLIVWDQDLLNEGTELGLTITAEAALRTFGIYIEDTIDISDLEN